MKKTMFEETFGDKSEKKLSQIEQIMHGNVSLINLQGGLKTFSHGNKDKLYSVSATFCNLDWDLHKTDPSSYPMNKDLIAKSKYCEKTKFHMDLFDVVTKLREFDSKNNNNNSNIHTMEPKGFVFHESRCGSTLVANSLAAFEPEKNRVYSESSPPVTAAKFYNQDHEEVSLQILRDTIYVMGRTNDEKEENLFFKVQSIGVKSIHVFRKAFPQTPWIFVYRDPVQVMKSHLTVKGTTMAVCLRYKNRPPKDLVDLVHRIGGADKTADSLNYEEFCAAHLATLCDTAARQAKDSNGLGKVVNYNNLIESLIHDLIPKHFMGVESLSEEAQTRIEEVSGHYSKGRGKKKAVWAEDSQQKEDSAWQEMKDASSMYLQPSYMELEELQKSQ